ncbi:MAG: AsmA-like C-terminal region-containing protein [Desulfovibrionaceae bacterium]|nr:AsmA-like C-terminal region-containing protein [Desulfovibrionaceae bacterium]
MPPVKRFYKSALALCCALALLLLLCAVAAVYTVHHHPDIVLEPVQQAATAAGISIRIGSLDASLFPLPSLALHDVQGTGKGFDFFIAHVTMRPNIWQLLHGRTQLGSLSLSEPDLRYTLSKEQAQQASPELTLADITSLVLPALPFDTTLKVRQGRLTLNIAQHSVVLDDVNAHFSASAPYGLQGFASAGMVSFWQEQHSVAWVQQVRFDCRGDVLAMPQGAAGGLSLSLYAPQQAQLPAVNMNIAVEQAPDATQPRTVSASLTGQSPVPFSLSMLGSWAKKQFYIDECALGLGQDSAEVTGTITFADQAQPAFTGHVLVHKLSLPQWFGFARAFPAGLQHALDAISGSMDVRLDAQGLYASNLRATACGSTFTGGGGVADWRKPVISLDISAPTADLGRILPESLGKEPSAPHYGHEVLLPLTQSNSEGGTAIGYAIFLRTELLRYGALQGGKVLFGVSPAPTSVALSADIQQLYGGSGNATILLDVDKPVTGYAITASLKDVRLAEAGKALPLRNPLPSGKSSISATLTASGDRLNDFLHSLRGIISTESASGELFMPSKKSTANDAKPQYSTVPHSGLRLSLEPRRLHLEKGTLDCDGLWNMRLQTEAAHISTRAEGAVHISTQGVRCSALNISTQYAGFSLKKAPKPITLDVNGILAADTTARTYSLNKAVLRAYGAEFSGNAACSLGTNGLRYSATGTLKSPALRQSLAQMGISLPKASKAEVYGKASISATINGTENKLSVQALKATIDSSTVTGKLDWRDAGQENPASLSGSLTCDNINADAYMPPANPQASKADSAWNTAFFTEQALDVQLHIGKLRYKNSTWHNLSLPLVLGKGSLNAKNIRATLYGGSVTGSLTASLKGSALQTQLNFAVQQADMLAATRDRVMSSDIAGKGSFSATVSGLLPSPALALGALDGIWKIQIEQGYEQSRNAQGQATGSKTLFSNVTASGSIDKGLVRTSNFMLLGTDLSMSGYGSLNLLTEAINAHFTLKFPHAPDVPVEISGTVDKPKTLVRADKVLINGIGKLGSGLFNIMGNVAGGALLLLQ